ncbi:NTP transferase domain-containing protein [bacterium]|nr:NTP transferase domain-containing protein [bacterium]
MRKVIILQARLASSRFPNKVLAELSGRPMISHIIERLKASKLADELNVAIPAEPSEDALANALEGSGVTISRGHPTDVLGRYIQAAYQTGAEIIVRATADNPFVCPQNLDNQIQALLDNPETDYVITEGLPVGVTVETFSLKTLEKLDFLARSNNHREHVTLYLREHPGPFVTKTLHAPAELNRPNLRLTVDTPAELARVQSLYDKVWTPGSIADLASAVRIYDENPSAYEQVATAATA